MSTTLSQPDEISVQVTYGIGHSCVGRFARAAVQEIPARDLIELVARSPQQPGRATRAAQVVTQVLRSERVIDAEVVEGSRGEVTGRPIALDEKVVRARGGRERSDEDRDEVSIRISESYVGG
jgi:hypothetical protein